MGLTSKRIKSPSKLFYRFLEFLNNIRPSPLRIYRYSAVSGLNTVKIFMFSKGIPNLNIGIKQQLKIFLIS